MPIAPEEIDNITAAVEKEYGVGTMHLGSASQKVARIPFPSIELNMATGGGVPIGKVSRFFGNFSSGKSLTSMNLIKNAQNLHIIAQQLLESEHDAVKRKGEEILERWPNGLECAYYNVEKVYDEQFAQSCGVDTDRLIVVEGSRIEPMAKILEASLGAIHLHIVDSASAAYSIDEAESKVEDWHRGIKARVWGKVLDHWKDHFDMHDNAIILIDQVRINMQTGAENPPGGKALEHASDMTLHFKRGKHLYERDGILKPEYPKKGETVHGSPEADGFEIQVRVTKSRVGRPFRLARLQVSFKDNTSFDQEFELAKSAEYFQVVERGGSWYTLPNGDKVQGEKGLRQALAEDVQFRQSVMEAVENYVVENP